MTTTAYLYIYTNTPFYSLVLQPSELQHGSAVSILFLTAPEWGLSIKK